MNSFLKAVNYQLSNHDLIRVVDQKCHVYLYSDLLKFDSLESAFYPHDCIFLLYESQHHSGHWCLILDRGHEYEFFDPFGLFPDKELRIISKKMKLYNTSYDEPYLSYLLLLTSKPKQYNNYQFQDIRFNTCGRHVLCRYMLKHLDIDQYYKFIKKFDILPDILVTFITFDV